MEPLADLLVRVEGATGPERELDRDIARAFGWHRVEPRFTRNRRGAWIAPEDFIGVNSAGAPVLDQTHGTDMWPDVPSLTSSLDAALALVERLELDANELLHEARRAVAVAHALHMRRWKTAVDGSYAQAFALALLAALLRALILRAATGTEGAPVSPAQPSEGSEPHGGARGPQLPVSSVLGEGGEGKTSSAVAESASEGLRPFASDSHCKSEGVPGWPQGMTYGAIDDVRAGRGLPPLAFGHYRHDVHCNTAGDKPKWASGTGCSCHIRNGSTGELYDEQARVEALWDEMHAPDPETGEPFEGHGGSPGEWMVERLDEIATELRRRRLPVQPDTAPDDGAGTASATGN